MDGSSFRDTEALSIHDCKPPGLSRRSCELHAGRRLFARNAGWHIRQEYVVRASPDADDRIAAKTEGEGVRRNLDFYRLRPCLFLKFDAGYGRLYGCCIDGSCNRNYYATIPCVSLDKECVDGLAFHRHIAHHFRTLAYNPVPSVAVASAEDKTASVVAGI